jgi:hypothetical protein
VEKETAPDPWKVGRDGDWTVGSVREVASISE